VGLTVTGFNYFNWKMYSDAFIEKNDLLFSSGKNTNIEKEPQILVETVSIEKYEDKTSIFESI
jgi:hypothetical protein